MTLTRTDIGSYHLISGTVSEVFVELSQVGIDPINIAYIKSDGTECIYKHGIGTSATQTKIKEMPSDAYIA